MCARAPRPISTGSDVKDGWRGRRAGLAVVTAFVAGAIGPSAAGGGGHGTVLVSDPDGRVLASVPLGDDGTFSLRYRNSLYGTLATERFVALEDGGFALNRLSAQQIAVLEEYYAVGSGPVAIGEGWWSAEPAYELELEQLRVAATDLGVRTLLVGGEAPVDLWRLVDDAAPSVVISVDRPP